MSSFMTSFIILIAVLVGATVVVALTQWCATQNLP